jgi:GNAT superfamily N-acetyltransferase
MGASSRFSVRALAPGDAPAAAALLAERHRRLRERRPELPAAFADASTCEPPIRAMLGREGAHGVLLEGPDGPAGYLVGFPRTEPIWGRACWSPIEGSALADGAPAEAIRDLYAAWSEHFVTRGMFLHYVHAPVDDPELMAAWVRTGFGQMQAHAVRELDLAASVLPGVTIRRVGTDEIDLITPLLPLIGRQLMRPPAYAARMPEEFASYLESWREELAEEEAHHWLAEEDGSALSMATFYAAEPGPMVPDRAWELAVAMTLPEARGRGLIRAIVATGFAEAREAGAEHCITDWRTASLPTHRSWTALGFRPTHYRMHRHIDERIAWADARAF